MDNLLTILGKTVGCVLFLGVAYLSYRFIWKDSVPSFSYKGWNTLHPAYAATHLPPRWATTSVRMGADLYQGTMQVALDAQGVYFRRTLPGPYKKALYIPYSQFRLVAKPRARTGLFSLGVYGIFDVDGVAIWLDNPYADQLIGHLTP